MSTDHSIPSEVRRQLVERRAQLLVRQRRIDIDLAHRSDPLVADFSDQAVQRGNDATLAGIADSTDAELLAIDEALRRLDTGEYGTCARCSAPIEAERLRAVPYAVTCVDCAHERVTAQ